MAKPIVDGIPEQTNESVEVINLKLLVGAGRETAGRYGVRMVPATVLLDSQGQLLDHRSRDTIQNQIQNRRNQEGRLRVLSELIH